MRQQQLELRAERLQLQQQLETLTAASSSSQQLVQQLAAAQKAAAAEQAGLRQQLEQVQGQVRHGSCSISLVGYDVMPVHG